jgi:hypothetical protein
MNAEVSKAIGYAEKLSEAVIDVVRLARVDLDETWARNPKVVALTLLCRSWSNFQASMRLVQQGHGMEARSLVRCLHENLLWLGALRERGAAFVEEMRRDGAFQMKALGELTLRLSGKHGGDLSSPDSVKLREAIKERIKEFDKLEKLNAGKIAAMGAVELTYVEYVRFSLDALHCSVTALDRHLSRALVENKLELTVSVEPRTTEAEILNTVLHACTALMGAAVCANEMVGLTSATEKLGMLMTEFEHHGWVSALRDEGAG